MVETEILRGILAPVGHGLWTAILGGTLFGVAARRGRLRLSRAVLGWYLLVALLHTLWDASQGIAVWLTLLLTGTQVQWLLIRLGRAPEVTPAQVHLFTILSWALLAVDAVMGLLILRRRWRRAATMDRPAAPRVPRVALLALVVLALALTGCTATAASSSVSPSTADVKPSALALQQQFVQVVKQVGPSVVLIRANQGLGSGIVFDANGNVVTNNHVVANAGGFQVTLANGKQYRARLVGSSPTDDLAVLHVDAGGLHPAAFADSSRLQVGDVALAIGNPLGLQSSVTEGIVSALGRTVNEDNGVGFAIPSNTVREVASQLISKGKVTNSHRAWLGVEVAATTSGGLLVTKVEPGGRPPGPGSAPGS
ncbi:MAG TPA: trypsin-like peptidase domain-containing protein [Actinomycetes bacterium]|nr:trypsin-like peptidase domain-containing protein [Actinomycetes bacterium]